MGTIVPNKGEPAAGIKLPFVWARCGTTLAGPLFWKDPQTYVLYRRNYKERVRSWWMASAGWIVYLG